MWSFYVNLSMSIRIVKGFSAEVVHFSFPFFVHCYILITKKELADQKIGLDGIF